MHIMISLTPLSVQNINMTFPPNQEVLSLINPLSFYVVPAVRQQITPLSASPVFWFTDVSSCQTLHMLVFAFISVEL